MSRLPARTEAQLDGAARPVWDDITSGRRGTKESLLNPEGGLIGPFNAWVTAPAVGERAAKLGEALRFDASIERHLVELAIITVGAHWQAEFEWWAHTGFARTAGIGEDVIAAIREGRPPPLTAGSPEAVVHEFARQLVSTGRVDDGAYAAASALLDDQAMVELVALVGYYSLVSMTLNAFRVPLPAGVEPAWPEA
ncbi:MAG TPA: hypothetical protein VGO92_11490 [Acidimicrobiales bacterium]|jgi:4-carboxymuconolactone decarboxylase|nr:hypothetical protein [Acidimicrobiales bacterium]